MSYPSTKRAKPRKKERARIVLCKGDANPGTVTALIRSYDSNTLRGFLQPLPAAAVYLGRED
jgi:hypothetical protein